MIDTHAHLDFPEFEKDREEVIARAFNNGVRAIVNVGVDIERNKKSIEIAEKFDGVFAAVGMHPDFFSKGDLGNQGDWEDWVEKLKKLARCKKVVAIGETGLDYSRIGEIRESGEIGERQRKGFLAQIEIAKELGLPVIVHCRNAFNDLHEIIKKFQFSIFPPTGDHPQGGNFRTNPNDKISKNKKILNTKYPPDSLRDSKRAGQIPDAKFVLHCYSGEKKDTEKFLKLENVYFSFSGNITYPKPAERAEKLAEAVKMIPLDKIMLDSDAPFLAPQEFRGKRGEPAYVRYIAEKIAEIKQISVGEVERTTDENAARFFHIARNT